MIVLNDQLPKFQNPDVRWALALLIDIKAVDMALIAAPRRSRRFPFRRPEPIRSTTSIRWSSG